MNSDSSGGWFFAFIMLLAWIIVLANDESISDAGMDRAKKMCSTNEGVSHVVVDNRMVGGSVVAPVGKLMVTCKNKAIFKLWEPEKP